MNLQAWNFVSGSYIAVMKSIFVVSLAALFFATGCNQSGSSSQTAGSTNSTAGDSVLQAPADYVNGLGRAKQNAGKTADVASLNQAIQMFQVDKGRFPKDLDELVQEKFLTKIPDAPYGMKINYDPTTGTATVVKQ
jgi:hypothetical protein